MSVPSSFDKRKTLDDPISPPPTKRKLQSGTTKNAVANFFTPTSQKPKDLTVWSERSPSDDIPATLLVGRYNPPSASPKPNKRRKIAAFDLDSTLIATSSGKKHASGATDWKWWHNTVPDRLRKLYNEDGYRVVILSNQAGLTLHFGLDHKGPKAAAQKRVSEFKQKCSAVLNNLDLPTSIYAATAKDIYRKPRIGMWKEMCEDYDVAEDEIDLKDSFFVGDAGGRIAVPGQGSNGGPPISKDFSCSDRNLAENLGIRYFCPEEYFLDEEPRTFLRDFDLANHGYNPGGGEDLVFEKGEGQEIVLFCGPPGAGKSTFYWKNLKPLGFERINQDTLKSRDKCVKVAVDLLSQGKSIAIDNTNADQETRSVWISLAQNNKIPIRCVWFKTPSVVCEHNDAVRANNKTLNPEERQGLPKLAFTGFASRFKPPQLKEGFKDLLEVDFKFRGTSEEYKVWGRYWL